MRLFVLASVAAGLVMYFAIGGFFALYYYRGRRAQVTAWKCQPERWPPARQVGFTVLLGTVNLLWMSAATGLLAFYVGSANPTKVYFRGHGAAYSITTAILYFLLTDLALYWMHRLYHQPLIYRWIHQLHHQTGAPTAFAALASHPVEFAIYVGMILAPLFWVPLHAAGVVATLAAHNVIALISHSGVRLPAFFPIDPQFHDDHHLYVHANYGQSLEIWDRLFGSCRRTG